MWLLLTVYEKITSFCFIQFLHLFYFGFISSEIEHLPFEVVFVNCFCMVSFVGVI